MDGIRRSLPVDRVVALDRSLFLQLPADLLSGLHSLVRAWRREPGQRRIDVTPMSEGWLKQLDASRGRRDAY